MELQKQETGTESGLAAMDAPKKRGRPKADAESHEDLAEGADSPIRAGSGNTWGVSNRTAMMSKDELKRKLHKLMLEESRMVTGRFLYHELPGGCINVFQRKYKDLPIFRETLVDQCTYTVPLWVARFLNGIDKSSAAYEGVIHSGAFPRYKHETKADGLGGVLNLEPIGSWTRRFSFQSMDFLV